MKAPFSLPKLPYAYAALAPHIDAATMEIHHTKHHQAYIDNLHKALQGTELPESSLVHLLQNISAYSNAVRNNAGGHYNHTLFWTILSPQGGGEPTGALGDALTTHFGSFASFKTQFTQAAAAQFGSGWAWLCTDPTGNLFLCTTPNQDNPLMDINEHQGTPILGLDVWEHAYYLQYQNRRKDYIAAFWHVVNWPAVADRFKQAVASG